MPTVMNKKMSSISSPHVDNSSTMTPGQMLELTGNVMKAFNANAALLEVKFGLPTRNSDDTGSTLSLL